MTDVLPEISAHSWWLLEYGSLVLFALLALGIVAFPIPEEALMTIAGILMREGKLFIPLTALCAYAGAITGITLSFLLGKTAGTYVMHRWGSYIGINEDRMRIAHAWFERFGKWLLVIGYFIPGIRHLTGFFAGVSELRFKHFALFAYSGAILWVSTFLLLGYYVGDYVFKIVENLEIIDLIVLAVSAIIFIILFLIAYKYKTKKSSKL